MDPLATRSLLLRLLLVAGLVAGVSVVAAVAGPLGSGSVVADGGGGFVSITPTRVLDTRTTSGGSGPVAPGSPVTVELAGVPASAAAAVVNVTATNAVGDGFVTVWDCDGAAPPTSNGNYVGIGTVAANVITSVNADAEICVATGDAPADVLVDVMGYYPAGSGVVTIAPTRSLDTRSSSGGSGPVQPGSHVTASLDGIPADAAAAIVNITATNATADGFFVVWDCDGDAPDTSNGNYVGVSTIANSAITPIGDQSQICVQTGDGAADILVDTVGYLTADSGYTAVSPARLLDTRTTDTPLAPGDTATITLTDVPAGDTAIVNVTAANARGDGYFTVWNCDGPAPGTSNGNYVGVTTIANTAIITPNTDQQICVRTGDAAAHIIIDTTGHTTAAAPNPTPTTTTTVPDPGPTTTTTPTTTVPDPGPTTTTIPPSPDGNPFKLKITTEPDRLTMVLPLRGVVDVEIDWGDNGANGCLTTATGSGDVSCTYATPGTYDIAISPGVSDGPWLTRIGLGFASYVGVDLIVEINSFGTLGTEWMSGLLNGGGNPTLPDDVPATVTNLSNMFRNASTFNQDISAWNTSNVTNMSSMFTNAAAFNNGCPPASSECPLEWNTAKVTNMVGMFENTSNFNQNIGGWVTGAVTNMSFMFHNATAFNRDISDWDTASVTTMRDMFFGATAFNNGCDTGVSACPLTTDGNSWDTRKVTNMSNMFRSTPFNQDIGDWNTSSVTDMRSMFNGASMFNQNIGNWDTSSVTAIGMGLMFNNAAAFNQDLSQWCVANITAEPSNFATGAGSVVQPSWGDPC